MSPTRLSGHTLEFHDRVPTTGPGVPPGTPLPPARGLLRRRGFWVALVAVVALVAAGFSLTSRDDSAPTAHTIEFQVSGTAPTASVTYTTAGPDRAQRADTAVLPFDRELTVRAIAVTASIAATRPAGATGSVSCTITIDGRVVASNTSSGTATTVACTGYVGGDPGDAPAGS